MGKNNSIYIFICFFAILQFCTSLLAQNRKVDSMRMMLQLTKEDTVKARLSNAIATELWQIASYDSAKKYAERVIRICDQNPVLIDTTNKVCTNGSACYLLLLQKARALRTLGIIFAERGDHSRSITSFFAAMKISEWLKDAKGISDSRGNLGHVYSDIGNYPEALKYYLLSLRQNESVGDKQAMAIDYGNIGIIYRLEGNYEEAIKYHNLSLEIHRSAGNKQGEANCYNSIALVHRLKGEYAEAIRNYELALQLRKDGGNKRGTAFTLVGIGTTYDLQKDHDKAKKYFDDALNIFKEIGDKQGMAGTYINLGILYNTIGKLPLSEKYYEDALPLAIATGSKDEIREIHHGLAGIDSAKGDMKNSLEHFKLYIVYRDSIFNEANTKKLVQDQMQYEFEKQSAADSIRTAEKKKQDDLRHEQEIQQQKAYSYGGLGGFVLMLLVAIVSIRAFRNKQKANEIISHQKSLVEEKQKEILDSIHYAKRIQTSLLPTEKYIERNLNRLKN